MEIEEAIVRQTTMLIAQLSTAAIRAPLSNIADEELVDLAAEAAVEAQSVTRKVGADMLGLTLRSYQKKVQKLTESQTVREVWEAVMLDFLPAHSNVSAERLLERFRNDSAEDLGSIFISLLVLLALHDCQRLAGRASERTSSATVSSF
jgi:hypothetical protein